jgi:carbon starvation protein
MNAVFVIVAALVVAVGGYRWYTGYVDRKVLQVDSDRITPAKMYNDGVDFMPTSRNVLFGYQFKSIAGAAPVVGAIVALQWGWLPALLWLFGGVLFIGWLHDYISGMVSMRSDGLSLGGLSYKLVSPRARLMLMSFIYFYLLLIAGAFGAIIAGAFTKLPSGPVAILILTLAGVLAGQMIYRVRANILLTTVICVALALFGIWLGEAFPTTSFMGALAGNKLTWALLTLLFCFISAVLPIWRFALPVNYVSFYIIIIGIVGGIIGIFVGHPTVSAPVFTQVTIRIGPLWPMLFVTIACGAISGWHSLVSSSGTSRQLERETDARPVLAGSMFVEMILGVVALLTACAAIPFAQYKALLKHGPVAVFAAGLANLLHNLGMPIGYGKTMAVVIIIILAITVMQLVLRFMKIATVELVGDYSPILRNGFIATLIAALITLLIIETGWWQYLWVLFGGANQLLASLALMIGSLYLMSQGKRAIYTLIPMWFMFITTIAALVYTSYNLFSKVAEGKATGAALVGNCLMGVVAIFLVIMAIFLLADGLKAMQRYRQAPPVQPEPAVK